MPAGSRVTPHNHHARLAGVADAIRTSDNAGICGYITRDASSQARACTYFLSYMELRSRLNRMAPEFAKTPAAAPSA